jgi:hypothetical protein
MMDTVDEVAEVVEPMSTEVSSVVLSVTTGPAGVGVQVTLVGLTVEDSLDAWIFWWAEELDSVSRSSGKLVGVVKDGVGVGLILVGMVVGFSLDIWIFRCAPMLDRDSWSPGKL